MKMPKLTQLIEKRMTAAYKKAIQEDPGRDYIGASAIGANCWRQIWYELKGHKGDGVSNEIRRTWKLGKLIELMMIELLRDIGFQLITPDDVPGKLAFCDPEYFFFKGHMDAVLLNPERILELKAVKDSSFKIFKTKGFQGWSKRYFDQVQAYMGMSGIHKAHVLMINKDSSELWDEQVEFDPIYYRTLRDKARMIYEAQTEPPRVHNSPVWYECKLCKFKKICHQ